MAPEAPSGQIVSIVFTDMESSSEHWESSGAEFYAVLQHHLRLVRESCEGHKPEVVKFTGDGFFMAFLDVGEAISLAVDTLMSFAANPTVPRVRIGMDTGVAYPVLEQGETVDFVGPAVNRAARICAKAAPSSALISEGTKLLAERGRRDLTFESVGVHSLRNIGRERLYVIRSRDLPDCAVLVPEPASALPMLVGPSIGRLELIDAVQTALSGDSRCVALVGTGGVGKTRLAIESARKSQTDFPEGVTFVELDGIRDRGLAEARIAAALRAGGMEGEGRLIDIIGHLKDKRHLLVLDGVEGLAQASELVLELLGRSDHLRILCTTRRRQRLPAQFLDVPPLRLEDAIELFRIRVEAGGEALSPQSEPDVRALCRRLSGIPLAIELAAARHGVLTARQMLDRMDAGLGWLKDTESDAESAGHHASLEQTIGWSYELLSAEARIAFKQAAVFPVGFHLDRWEEIAGPEGLDSLAELHHSSLLSVESRSDQPGRRYYLLETIRLFALKRLKEDAALFRSTALKHAKVLVDIGSARMRLLRTSGESDALQETEQDVSDLDAVIENCGLLDAPVLRAEACEILAAYWHNSGTQRWALSYADKGLEAVGDSDSGVSLRLLRWRAAAAIDLEETAIAQESAERMLQLAQGLNGSRRALEMARAYNMLGIVAEPEAAGVYYAKALALAIESGDREIEGMVRHNLGMLAFRSHAIDEANAQWTQTVALREASGDLRGICETSTNLGLLELERGEVSASRSRHLQALQCARMLRDVEALGRSLFNLAELDETAGDADSAKIRYAAAHALFTRTESANTRFSLEAVTRLGVGGDLLEQLSHLSPEEIVDKAIGSAEIVSGV